MSAREDLNRLTRALERIAKTPCYTWNVVEEPTRIVGGVVMSHDVCPSCIAQDALGIDNEEDIEDD